MIEFESDLHKTKICILLTATIDPKGIIHMKRNDPLVREKDYINAIKKWKSKIAYPIVFCENSGYNLCKVEKIMKKSANRKFETLQFDGQDFPRELGKGYGELLTIKYAIEHSTLIRHSEYVIKINGRYFVKNIMKIIEPLLESSDIYIMADLREDLNWAKSKVFAFKPTFVSDYLAEFQNLINDSKNFYFEHALHKAISRAVSESHKWLPFPSAPIIIGYSGTFNTPLKKLKDL